MTWLVHVVMTLVSMTWLWNGHVAQDVARPEPEPPLGASASPRPPLVVVRALGPVPGEQLRGVCRVLLAEHPVRCVVRGSRSVTEAFEAWDPEREQLDARHALDLLFESRGRDAVVELDVTTLDLYEDGKPYVFGLASLPDRTALLSTARLRDDDPKRAEARLRTLVRHEFGHAVGLAHHDVAGCVMRQDPTVAELDGAPDGPCEVCHGALASRLDRLGRPGQTALDRARGLLVRDRREDARQTLVEALWAYRLDVPLLEDFARVFYEAGQYNETISLLRHAIEQDPGHPSTHVQLGLAYQRRGREGDLALAIDRFEQALELRPDWESVAEHLAVTREELRAQGP
ncbi:hypothetical protein [Paraliomyxa miuraensis]|uniref:hypothetical protein n=1 Tax=Paraliomyxa miuraensis TaxID=376150 RepID=UPI0022508B6A|nr:hypothetical protein [Paraliomyxa miuraensis]MCX4245286.1 hypothetical protein [Paraliomyxa miuraensis]